MLFSELVSEYDATASLRSTGKGASALRDAEALAEPEVPLVDEKASENVWPVDTCERHPRQLRGPSNGCVGHLAAHQPIVDSHGE